MERALRVHVQEKTVDTDTKAKTRPRLPWQENDEKELVRLAKQGMPVRALAERFHRQPEAVRKKLERLGLNTMASKIEVSGKLIIPSDLPSLEEVLKIVAGAGDVNADGIVDTFDCIIVASAFGSGLSGPNWNTNADINSDQLADIFDIIIEAANYGQTYTYPCTPTLFSIPNQANF